MVPDVGEILKNKVDTDFFWFCNGCFSKFWNICRPILFIKVLNLNRVKYEASQYNFEGLPHNVFYVT